MLATGRLWFEHSRHKLPETSAAGEAHDSSQSTNEEGAQNGMSRRRKPPLISLAMLRRVMGDDIASLRRRELSRRVYAGVLLKDDQKQGKQQEQPYTHKYWVHKDLNKSCWMVLAKALQIDAHDSKSWRWTEEEEPCYSGNERLPVAKLVGVRGLDIKGKCKTIVLSPRTMYTVTIVMKMMCESHRWKFPVNLSLELPDGSKQGRTESLDMLEEDKWTPVLIGEFETTPKTVGEVSFSLTQTEKGWKPGLCIKGVVFTPTTEKKPPR
ncbi:hypothetical protein BT93_E2070 [Corymbia citriodora subsp. variegata]|nr:hypothetical protein BT93_E2070 [Corymbia citriodora subsp. variegata]